MLIQLRIVVNMLRYFFLMRIAMSPYGLPCTILVVSSIALKPNPSNSESILDNIDIQIYSILQKQCYSILLEYFD